MNESQEIDDTRVIEVAHKTGRAKSLGSLICREGDELRFAEIDIVKYGKKDLCEAEE